MLLLVLNATVEQFRTGWFLESAISEVLILLVVRTRKPFFRSKPGKYLMIAGITVTCAILILPYTPLSAPLGFVPIPLTTLLALLGILALYVTTAEAVKRLFYAAATRRQAQYG
jgi:Mg2+-importing ATPase